MHDIAEKAKIEAQPLAWVAWFGQMFFWLVEVAVPGGLANQFWQHWIHIAYLCEILLIIGGLFIWDTVFTFGAWTMLFTVLLHVVVTVLGDTLRGRRGTLYAVGAIVGLLAGSMMLLGVFSVLTEFGTWPVPAGVVRTVAVASITTAVVCTFGWLLRKAIWHRAWPTLRWIGWLAALSVLVLGLMELLRAFGVLSTSPTDLVTNGVSWLWSNRPLFSSE
jgi:hypothetical protein